MLIVAVLSGLVLGLVACGSDPTPTPRPTPTPSREGSVNVFGVDRVSQSDWDNFSVPLLRKSMDELYAKAIADEGGEVVVWEFADISPAEKAAFSARFPGMSISSRGLGPGSVAAVLQAIDAGVTTTDVYNDGIDGTDVLRERGLYDETIDWVALGVPSESLVADRPGMVSTRTLTYEIWYNSDCIDPDTIPTDPFDFLSPEWKGKLTGSNIFVPLGFSFYGLKYGEDRMVELVSRLISEDILLVTETPQRLVLTCERPILMPANRGMLGEYSLGAPVDAKGYDGMGRFDGIRGVLKDSPHPNGAKLFMLWESFDPDWRDLQFSDPNIEIPTMHLALPRAEENPNIREVLAAGEKGWVSFMDQNNAAQREAFVGRLFGVVAGN
jgi:hypothetical protein